MIEWRSVRAIQHTGLRRTLHEELVHRIGQMIQDGELVPGQHIPEVSLCRMFDVSRTPLREALKVLASEGFVVWEANRGARVARVAVEEVAAAFEFLGALERLIGETICGRLTDADVLTLEAMHKDMLALHARGDRTEYFRRNQEIHCELARLTRNPVTADVYASLQKRIFRARALSNLHQTRWDASVREHELIMAAIRQRDPGALTGHLTAHNAATCAVILEELDRLK